jgi:anti-sigma regulatory factor (Ser/Thr protein kinase)
MDRVVIDFNVDDTATSLEQFLKRLEPCYTNDRTDPLVIDFSSCQYLGPDAAAVLYALHLRARQRGIRDLVVAPLGPKPLVAFWSFSGLAHYLEKGRRPTADDPRSETVPLTQEYQAGWGRAMPILRLVKRHISITPDDEQSLQICFSEVIQNIDDHASSQIGGIWCARFFASRNEIRVAVVDRGRGIATTLRQRFPDIVDDSDAVRRVLAGGHSSLSRANNQGLGLSNLAAIVQEFGGAVMIATGTAFVEVDVSAAHPRVKILPYSFPGTGVFFVLPVNPGR